MGYDQRKITIEARVSRHHSPKDRLDDAYWALLVAMVNQILDDVDFSTIQAMVTEG